MFLMVCLHLDCSCFDCFSNGFWTCFSSFRVLGFLRGFFPSFPVDSPLDCFAYQCWVFYLPGFWDPSFLFGFCFGLLGNGSLPVLSCRNLVGSPVGVWVFSSFFLRCR